jgi:glycosyltransferase involved in cell wall biosynthesis
MRIAQISPLYESVPPTLYGGTERVVATLADALTDLGHDVTLFASADSRTRARLEPARDCALWLDKGRSWDLPAHLTMLEEVRRRRDEFDIIHFHTDCLQMAMFGDVAGKTLTTLHGRLDYKDLKPFLATYRRFPLVSISDSQRGPVRSANFVATVPHGLDPSLLTPPASPSDDYLAFLGRFSPEKRPDRAIEIAIKAGWPLRIAAKLSDTDRGYFDEKIRPLLEHPLVDWVGEIGDADKSAFLGNARALLFPIDWPEPFGLVMIEAMASGTPVIAWPKGAAPEVVEHGVTGFLVDSIAVATSAVAQAGALDRQAIRRRFERRFSAEAMARGYVEVYRSLLARRAGPKIRLASAADEALPAPHVAAAALGRRGGGGRPPV